MLSIRENRAVQRAARYVYDINNKKKLWIGSFLLIFMVVATGLIFGLVLPEAKRQDKESPVDAGLSRANSQIIIVVILLLTFLILLIHVVTKDSNRKNTGMSLAVTLLLLGLLLYIALDQAPKMGEAGKEATTKNLPLIITIEMVVVGGFLALSLGLITWKMGGDRAFSYLKRQVAR